MALQSHNSLMMMINIMLLLLLTFSTISIAQTSFRPKGLVLKVTKDASTGQYLTTIPQGSTKYPAKLTLDLGGDFMWVNCETAFNSSTRRSIPCRTAQCRLSASRHCYPAGICGMSAANTVTFVTTSGDLYSDSIELKSIAAGVTAQVPNLIFTCTKAFLTKGLAEGSIGIAGLGRTKVSLPSLLSAAFSFPRTFSVCLTPSPQQGFVLFGENNENEILKKVSETLTYTPLVLNPRGEVRDPSPEYFIGVKSIKVNGKTVPVNATLFSFNENSHGGVKLSTVRSHTVMETSVHRAVVAAFDAAATSSSVVRVASVPPFASCYVDDDVAGDVARPGIEFVMRNEREVWRFEWSEITVKVNGGDDVACLGILDGGELGFLSFDTTQSAVIIGGRQIENRLLRIDLASSRLGLSSSISAMKTSCSNLI